jgi:peptidoglycan/LPS O-acetylase OafA/YrhL
MSAWFRPKKFGYGATPVAWQGWAVVAVGVISIAAAAGLILAPHGGQPWAWIAFFATAAAVLALVLIVSRRKTEGEWRWRWGDR